MDYKRTIIEKENLHIQNMVEDERIKKVNISGLFRVQKLFFMYNSKRESLQDRLQLGLAHVNNVLDRPYFNSSLFIGIDVFC